jgi:hypothetical protein
MDRVLTRLKYIALGVFALCCAGVWAYQIVYARPEARCEQSGRWWSSEYRICGTPVRLSRFTHRPDRAPAPAGTPGI